MEGLPAAKADRPLTLPDRDHLRHEFPQTLVATGRAVDRYGLKANGLRHVPRHSEAPWVPCKSDHQDSHGGSCIAKVGDIPTPLPTPGGSLTPITEEPSDGEFEEWDTYLVADLEADTDVNEAFQKARTDLYHIFGEDNLIEAEDEETEEMQRLSDALK